MHVPRSIEKGLVSLTSPARTSTEFKGERKMRYDLAALGFALDMGSSGGEVFLAVPQLPGLTLGKILSHCPFLAN